MAIIRKSVVKIHYNSSIIWGVYWLFFAYISSSSTVLTVGDPKGFSSTFINSSFFGPSYYWLYWYNFLGALSLIYRSARSLSSPKVLSRMFFPVRAESAVGFGFGYAKLLCNVASSALDKLALKVLVPT